MKNKGEIRDKMMSELLSFQISGGGGNYEYYQFHIDNIDKIVDERIACLVNLVIQHAIYAFKTNNYSDYGVFGQDRDYTRELGLSMQDLGDFPKNPSVENIDNFIVSMNQNFDINMPTRTEYNKAVSESSNNPSEESSKALDDIKRRNGEKIYPSGQYGNRYLEELANQDSSAKKI